MNSAIEAKGEIIKFQIRWHKTKDLKCSHFSPINKRNCKNKMLDNKGLKKCIKILPHQNLELDTKTNENSMNKIHLSGLQTSKVIEFQSSSKRFKKSFKNINMIKSPVIESFNYDLKIDNHNLNRQPSITKRLVNFDFPCENSFCISSQLFEKSNLKKIPLNFYRRFRNFSTNKKICRHPNFYSVDNKVQSNTKKYFENLHIRFAMKRELNIVNLKLNKRMEDQFASKGDHKKRLLNNCSPKNEFQRQMIKRRFNYIDEDLVPQRIKNYPSSNISSSLISNSFGREILR